MKTKEFILAEREELSRLLSHGLSLICIAKLLGKDKGTISREVSRDGMDRFSYRAYKAHRHAKKEKKKQGRKRIIDNKIFKGEERLRLIEEKLGIAPKTEDDLNPKWLVRGGQSSSCMQGVYDQC